MHSSIQITDGAGSPYSGLVTGEHLTNISFGVSCHFSLHFSAFASRTGIQGKSFIYGL